MACLLVIFYFIFRILITTSLEATFDEVTLRSYFAKFGYISSITKATVAIKYPGSYKVEPTNILIYNSNLQSMSEKLRARALKDHAVFATCSNGDPTWRKNADNIFKILIGTRKYPKYKLSPNFHYYFLNKKKKEAIDHEFEQLLANTGIAVALDVPNALVEMFMNFMMFNLQ